MKRLTLAIVVFGCRSSPAAPPVVHKPSEPAPEPAPVVEAPTTEAPEEPEEPEEPEAPEKPDPPPTPSASKAEVFSVVVSTKLVRLSPFVDSTRALFGAIPDFVLLHGGIDAIKDADYVRYASNDEHNPVAATVVVKHRLDTGKLMGAVELAFSARGETVEWSEVNGRTIGDPKPPGDDLDPRQVVILDKKHVAYVHPALVGKLDGQVGALKDFAKKHKLRTLDATINVPDPSASKRVPLAQTYGVTINAARNPTVRITQLFATAEKAKAFRDFFKDELGTILQDNLTLRLIFAPVYEETNLERKGNTIKLTVKLSTEQADTFLRTIASATAKFFRSK